MFDLPTAALFLVPLLSGLAFLAVKHPLTYLAIGGYLINAAAALAVFAFGFSLGVMAVSAALRTLIRNDAALEFDAATDRMQLGCVKAVALAIGLLGAIWVLAKISGHIAENEGGEKGKDEKPK